MKFVLFSFFAAPYLIGCTNSESATKTTVNEEAATNRPRFQESVRNEIDAEGSFAGEDSLNDAKVKGYIVKEMRAKPNYQGSTEFEYMNTLQLLEQGRARAKALMQTADEQNTWRDLTLNRKRGGQLVLTLYREMAQLSDTENFTVVIEDAAGKELYHEDLEHATPTNSGSMWWNLAIVGIKKKIRPPFYVNLVDRVSGRDEPRKYLVTPVMK